MPSAMSSACTLALSDHAIALHIALCLLAQACRGLCARVQSCSCSPSGAPYAAPLVTSLRASRHVRGEAARTCKNFPKRVLITIPLHRLRALVPVEVCLASGDFPKPYFVLKCIHLGL
ncbi:unnamed protein product [Rangifer tarandus platyrhynchus]|uniref:Uncharacterized protein n=2 Tax=Rangifer tarandus platyrhynchus TaxID=3082113 RepID=A0ACB0E814_RANTA|nr:unnamed protein product [Rangifer tarandus platyrhynchus]CAI9696773.1 unnamed protein product [Rangifer tarandus platyrhynchus]